jgi:hypothetical protein
MMFLLKSHAQILHFPLNQDKIGYYHCDITNRVYNGNDNNTYHIPIINKNAIDISKSKVGQVFGEVFEYTLNVDPSNDKGLIIEKSDENAKHDGSLVEGPFEHAKAGYIYQIVVNNYYGAGYYYDYRACVVGENIPYVILKLRPKSKRFSVYVKAIFISPDECFDIIEQRKIIEFAKNIGIDIGEMGVLRDRDSHKLYIIDANNTQNYSSPLYMNIQGVKALKNAANAFSKQFLSGI